MSDIRLTISALQLYILQISLFLKKCQAFRFAHAPAHVSAERKIVDISIILFFFFFFIQHTHESNKSDLQRGLDRRLRHTQH